MMKFISLIVISRMGNSSCDSSLSTGLIYRGSFSTRGRKGILPFSTAFRQAVGPTQPTIQWIPMFLSPGR